MSKEETVILLEQIRDSLEIIIQRSLPVNSVDDFTSTAEGMMRLDSICMQLVTIGEAVKNIDKYTGKKLFVNYQAIDWRGVMGLRDIIVHQYFNVDADMILLIVKTNIPELLQNIKQILVDYE